MKKTITLATAAACAVAMAACGVGADKSREDARDVTNVVKTPPEVVTFNNHYPNIENKCDGHGHRIFVNSDKVMAIYPDPTCDGFVRGQEPNIVLNSSSPVGGK